MLNPYYEQELNNLRTLAAEFGRRNPALAPLLGSSAAVDADVERVLEGVAFLTGLVHQRLDDDFPEFTQTLAQMLFPHFLRPMPCMTILRLNAPADGARAVRVPVGTAYGSVPIDGERAIFRSTQQVDIEPLALSGLRWERGNGQPALRLNLQFAPGMAAQWRGDRLRFWLGGSLAEAANLYRVLMRQVKRIEMSAPDQAPQPLLASALRPAGFEQAEALVPWPAGAHPAWRLLYDYFALPEKLLFVDLTGLSAWRERRGDLLQLRLVLDSLPDWAPDLTESSLVLNATPAVNLYRHDAHPLQVDHRQPAYRIQPVSQGRGQRRIFSIEEVRGRTAQGQESTYQPFSALAGGAPSYQMRLKPALNEGNGYDCYLSFPLRQGDAGAMRTVSVNLLCTDGPRPDGLRLGEIGQATDSSPARVGCTNIMGVTPYREPTGQGTLLWRVLSHLNANHVTLADCDHLRDLLSLYLSWQRGSDYRQAAGQRQVDALQDVQVRQERRLARGMAVEGSAIEVVCRGSHFAGPGAFFLFGAMLDEFFASCAAVNTFTALTLTDGETGEQLSWPAKVGRGRLL